MELIYYTIAALILYGLSDYILNSIEIRMGKRLPNRSLIFLVIITILAIVSFNIIRSIFAPIETEQQTKNIQTNQPDKKQTLENPAIILPNSEETHN